MNIIDIKGLNKTYNIGKTNATHALCGVDLQICEGESLAIMGVSGSGKSTLLHVIGCLDDFNEGEYTLAGKSAANLTPKEQSSIRNNDIGFVLQDYGLIYHESVYNNIRLPLLFSDKYSYKQIKNRVKEIMQLLNIQDLEKKKVKELSGGQKQRVAIARAIINDPAILLADEPTGALDSKTANEIMNLLLDLNAKGKTLIVVTHDIAVANMMGRIVRIVDGIIDNEDSLDSDQIVLA